MLLTPGVNWVYSVGMTNTATTHRPPSVRNMWTASANGVLVATFRTQAELDEWAENIGTPESVIRVTRDQLTIVAPAR